MQLQGLVLLWLDVARMGAGIAPGFRVLLSRSSLSAIGVSGFRLSGKSGPPAPSPARKNLHSTALALIFLPPLR